MSDKSFRPFWQNAIMGAAVAENPAVMTANGWYQDSNGDWQQDPEREGLDELRKSLLDIGIQGVATLTGEALINAAFKYAPQVITKIANKLGPKATRYLKTLTGKTRQQAERVLQGNPKQTFQYDLTRGSNQAIRNEHLSPRIAPAIRAIDNIDEARTAAILGGFYGYPMAWLTDVIQGEFTNNYFMWPQRKLNEEGKIVKYDK